MVDLSTTYLGLKLKNPLVASALAAFGKSGNRQRTGRSRDCGNGDVFAF